MTIAGKSTISTRKYIHSFMLVCVAMFVMLVMLSFLGGTFDLPRKRSRGNVITYNAAISACQKQGRWEAATRRVSQLRLP